MANPIIPSIPVEYTGLWADDHIVDLQDLGQSLNGLGRLSNSVVNFYLSGTIEDRRIYRVRVFAGPPHPSCVLYELFAIMQSGELPLYAKILCELGVHFLPELLRAIVFRAIHALALQHSEFATRVHNGHMQDKAWLQSQVDQLSQQNRQPMRDLVRPVGRSVKQIKLGNDTAATPAIIQEAEADALSSKDELEVGDMRRLRAIFEGVDTTNGSCKLRIDGDDKVLSGKITDPLLSQAGNIYTHSLDTKEEIVISAKPIVKAGETVRLFISDGSLISDIR